MLLIAYSTFLLNATFGILVKIRVIDNRRLRFVHHLLYFLVIASIAAAALVTGLAGNGTRAWLMGGMGAILLAMPLFRGWSRGHWMYAVFCTALYSALVFWP